jgi:hypothetical protein
LFVQIAKAKATEAIALAREHRPPLQGAIKRKRQILVTKYGSRRRFSLDLAQAARSPGSAATRTRATCATCARTEPEAAKSKANSAAAAAAATTEAAATTAANKSAAAATTEAATTSAAASAAAASAAMTAPTATTASAGQLHAAADVFPIEDIKRGETDVGHFLFAQDEALIGRVSVRLRDIRSGRRRCGCITHQRKT